MDLGTRAPNALLVCALYLVLSIVSAQNIDLSGRWYVQTSTDFSGNFVCVTLDVKRVKAITKTRVRYFSQINFFDKRDTPRNRMVQDATFDLDGQTTIEDNKNNGAILVFRPDYFVFYSLSSARPLSVTRKPIAPGRTAQAVKLNRLLGLGPSRVQQKGCLYIPPPMSRFVAARVKGRYFFHYVRFQGRPTTTCGIGEYVPNRKGGLKVYFLFRINGVDSVISSTLVRSNKFLPNQFDELVSDGSSNTIVFSEVGRVVNGAYNYFVATRGTGDLVVGVRDGISLSKRQFRAIAKRIERDYGFNRRELASVKNGKSCKK